MPRIHVLNQDTINKIAAGEVIERPMAVVKELTENAIDAGANSITVEIKDGGKAMIRITDNGSGIREEDIRLAFTPHATSKIEDVSDLLKVATLGFRGEALASVASVSHLEMITKMREELMGNRYLIDGGQEKTLENIGCPEGTTIIVRNLFYNTPARLKFLKSSPTEAGYINTLLERLAMSHPEIAFRFINQQQAKLHTSGNGNLKDVIYNIYGRDIANNLIEIDTKEVNCKISGYLGNPVISRGNRSFMNYFINGRYIKSATIQKAIEDAYQPYSMQHRYPFTVLHFEIDKERTDINVHPQKMEVRFTDNQGIYQSVFHAVSLFLKRREYIPEVTLHAPQEKKQTKNNFSQINKTPVRGPEPFEQRRGASVKLLEEVKKLNQGEDIRKEIQKQQTESTRNEQTLNNQTTSVLSENRSQNVAIPEEKVQENLTLKKEQKNYPIPEEASQTMAQVAESDDLKGEELRNAEMQSVSKGEEIRNAETQSVSKGEEICNAEMQSVSKEEEICNAETQSVLKGEEIRNAETQSVSKGEEFRNAETQSVSKEEQTWNTDKIKDSDLDVSSGKKTKKAEQLSLFHTGILSKQARPEIQIVGQIFNTYWILQYQDAMYIVDQHAAHEKVLFERFMKTIQEKKPMTQMLMPPVILTLNMQEEEAVKQNLDIFEKLGYVIDSFGGKEYSVSGVPAHLPSLGTEALLTEIIDSLSEERSGQPPEMLINKVASMSCKAAVKGNNALPREEMQELLEELMSLENPYHCPHGRPTMIKMTQKELEKKFKRIL